MKQGIRCCVSGTVQGVCFRASTRDKALELGLAGWVRNLPDGQVLVEAFGEPAMLEQLRSWLLLGPEFAKVQQLDCRWIEYRPHSDFSIR